MAERTPDLERLVARARRLLEELPGAEHVKRIFGASYAGVLSAVYIATFLARVAFGIVVVTFAAYVPRDLLNDFEFALLVAANPLFELASVLGVGLLIDRYGRRGVLLSGLALGAASLGGLALSRHVLSLGLFHAVHGVSAAAILVPTLAILADHAPKDKRGREMGGFNFVQIFGWFTGFVLGFVFQEVFASDLRITFIAAGSLALLGLVYAYVVLQEADEAPGARSGTRKALRDLADAAGNRLVLSVTVPWFLVFLFVGAFITFLGRTTTDVFDLGGFSTAVWMLVLAIVFLTTQVVFGHLSDSYGRDLFMVVGGVGFLGLMTTIAWGFSTAESDTPAGLLAAVGDLTPFIIVFVVSALAFPPAALAALADVARSDLRGTTMSIYTLAASLGMILGPLAAGGASEVFGHLGVIGFFLVVAVLLLAALGGRLVVSRASATGPGSDRL